MTFSRGQIIRCNTGCLLSGLNDDTVVILIVTEQNTSSSTDLSDQSSIGRFLQKEAWIRDKQTALAVLMMALAAVPFCTESFDDADAAITGNMAFTNADEDLYDGAVSITVAMMYAVPVSSLLVGVVYLLNRSR